ncbi:MAG: hypothetical protein ACYDA2_03420 [Acidimicrobiales bacterium]
MAGERSRNALGAGVRVDVRSRFVGDWSRGFEVAERVEEEDGYRLRRLSDGSILPDVFREEDLRPERRKTDFWWY